MTPTAISPNISDTYHVGDGPFSSIAVGLCDGGVGRLLAFLRPFETGMRTGYRISDIGHRISDAAVASFEMSDVMTERNETVDPAVRRDGWIVRSVRFAGWMSIWVGLFLLGFVAHQLFVTTYLAQQNNQKLEAEAEEYFVTVEYTEIPYVAPGAPELTDPVDVRLPVPALKVESLPAAHEAFAIIRVPSLDRLEGGWAIVEGVSRKDLKNGVGHMPSTPLPGQPGNSVFSGHRTTYGAPFHEFDELEPGDIIEVETGIGIHIYEVRETIIVRPTEIWVTQPRDGAWLTLTTCNPKFSARERLVVFAELVGGPNFAAISG